MASGDVNGLRRAFARAAASYDAAAALAAETGRRLQERLSYTRIAPRRIADIGCATGDGIRYLQTLYPAAQPLAVDFAAPMLHAVLGRRRLRERWLRRGPLPVQADVRCLPLAAGSVSLVWSNLMLHWLDDPRQALDELYRVIEPGGLLTFAVLGPDTAREWRQAAAKVGADETARNFLDMHDWGDLLVRAGFGDPVMDRDDIVLTYPSAGALLREQRLLGIRNALFGNPGWRRFRALLRVWPVDQDGRWPLSFEVVFGQAWKPSVPPPQKNARQVIRVYPAKPALDGENGTQS